MKAADVLPNYREELSRIPKLIESLTRALYGALTSFGLWVLIFVLTLFV